MGGGGFGCGGSPGTRSSSATVPELRPASRGRRDLLSRGQLEGDSEQRVRTPPSPLPEKNHLLQRLGHRAQCLTGFSAAPDVRDPGSPGSLPETPFPCTGRNSPCGSVPRCLSQKGRVLWLLGASEPTKQASLSLPALPCPTWPGCCAGGGAGATSLCRRPGSPWRRAAQGRDWRLRSGALD